MPGWGILMSFFWELTMTVRKGRVLLGRLGKGHKESQLNLAKNLGEAGFEVIYTELQDPESIVNSALQESVDHIGITTLPGADITAFEKIFKLLEKQDAGHISVTAGGYLDEEDIPKIRAMGLMAFFPRGTSFKTIIKWSLENIKAK